MNIFTNRQSELAQLESLYNRQGGQLVILYGRRRLGKTALLREFCRNKSHGYYMADKAGEQSQKKSMALAMSTALGGGTAAAIRRIPAMVRSFCRL